MWKTLWYLFLLGVLVTGAVWMADRPGSVDIEWQGWKFTTQVPVLLLALLIVAAVLTFLLRVLAYIRGAPRRFVEARKESAKTKGLLALANGHAAIAAGDSKAAHKYLSQAGSKLKDPVQTMLLSAQTLELEGDRDNAKSQLTHMLDHAATELPALRGLIKLARAEGDGATALGLARRADGLKTGAPWVAEQLFELESAAGHWAEAYDLLPRAAKAGYFKDERERHLRAVLLTAKARTARNEKDRDNFAHKAHDADPAFAPAALCLAEVLVKDGKANTAAAVIDKSWVAAPHPDLTKAFFSVWKGETALVRAQKAEGLAKHHPEHPESLLLIAETALEAELWGRARAQLAPLLETNRTRRVARLMAQLEQSEKQDVAAANAWLKKVPESLPNPAWRCTSCGTEASAWDALCPNCKTFDALAWSVPSRAVTTLK